MGFQMYFSEDLRGIENLLGSFTHPHSTDSMKQPIFYGNMVTSEMSSRKWMKIQQAVAQKWN